MAGDELHFYSVVIRVKGGGKRRLRVKARSHDEARNLAAHLIRTSPRAVSRILKGRLTT